jgi:hypothetical protein
VQVIEVPKKAIDWREKVEEDGDENNEGPVLLTGAYKSLQFDVKRIKERLHYISKK